MKFLRKASILLIIAFICVISSSCSEKSFSNNVISNNDLFLPSISVKFDLCDDKCNNVTDNTISNFNGKVNLNIENYSNFDIKFYIFVMINGIPVDYECENKHYNAYSNLHEVSLETDGCVIIPLSVIFELSDLIFTDNLLDVILIGFNEDNLPSNSITSNVNFAAINKYFVYNNLSYKSNYDLKSNFSADTVDTYIEFQKNNSYCFLTNLVEQDSLIQSETLNSKFYGVFSDTSGDEFFGIYIFNGKKLATVQQNPTFMKIPEDETIVREFNLNMQELDEDVIYCLKIPFFSEMWYLQFFEISKVQIM